MSISYMDASHGINVGNANDPVVAETKTGYGSLRETNPWFGHQLSAQHHG